MQFQKAVKRGIRLRLALTGPPGSGKTWTALTLGTLLADRVALIDTEHGSSLKYGDHFSFDVLELTAFHPLEYVRAIRVAEEAGYGLIIIDSLSHAWVGKDGALELVDRAAAKSKSPNTFGAWREVTPIQNELLEAILGSKAHVIATMRTKTEYATDKNERTGRLEVRKLGLAPIQRDNVEYEFDVVGDLDADNTLVVTKTRCPALSGAVYKKPGPPLAEVLRSWLAGPPSPPAPPPANGSAQPPASNAPQTGADLLTRLSKWQNTLVHDGLCDDDGALMEHVRKAGAVHGRSTDMGAWDRAGCEAAWQAASEFDLRCRREKVDKAREAAGRQWAEVMAALGLDRGTPAKALTRRQMDEALRMLREEVAPRPST